MEIGQRPAVGIFIDLWDRIFLVDLTQLVEQLVIFYIHFFPNTIVFWIKNKQIKQQI